MERAELRADTRTVRGKKVKRLRSDNLIPAVVYGPDMEAAPIQVVERSLVKTLHEVGSTALIDLFIDDAAPPHVVLAREIQRDPLTSRVQHVDFYTVRLTEKVKTTPRIEFVGTSPLVETGRGVVVTSMTEVEVECLPTDLISSITVDISVLEEWDDNVIVADLPVPPAVTVLADPSEVVVSVVPIRMEIEEEIEEVEEEIEAEEFEVEVEPEDEVSEEVESEA
jgi:large subunit ribosomal protein L25